MEQVWGRLGATNHFAKDPLWLVWQPKQCISRLFSIQSQLFQPSDRSRGLGQWCVEGTHSYPQWRWRHRQDVSGSCFVVASCEALYIYNSPRPFARHWLCCRLWTPLGRSHDERGRSWWDEMCDGPWTYSQHTLSKSRRDDTFRYTPNLQYQPLEDALLRNGFSGASDGYWPKTPVELSDKRLPQGRGGLCSTLFSLPTFYLPYLLIIFLAFYRWRVLQHSQP